MKGPADYIAELGAAAVLLESLHLFCNLSLSLRVFFRHLRLELINPRFLQ
jgi:hypothetical protein